MRTGWFLIQNSGSGNFYTLNRVDQVLKMETATWDTTEDYANIVGFGKHVVISSRKEEFGDAAITCHGKRKWFGRINMRTDNISEIVSNHEDDLGGLISILEDIQSRYGYLPQDALKIVAEKTGYSLVDIYGIATFYRFFSLKPRGEHHISVCLGTACHVRQGPKIAEEFERQLGIKAGETTPDKKFTLETVNCLGACALGPIVVVDGHYFSQVGISRVKKILESAKEGLDKLGGKENGQAFPLEVSCPRCNHSLMDPKHKIDDHPSIRVTVSFGSKHGWLRLSSLYGSYATKSEYKILKDKVVNFLCPHCHVELNGVSDCVECNAPMVPMIVRGGGMVQICSRRGCRNHMLDLNGVNL
jgi:NADH-quinone oxidoreductase subunit E